MVSEPQSPILIHHSVCYTLYYMYVYIGGGSGGAGGAGGAAAPTKLKVWGHCPHNRSQYFTSL